MIRHFLVFISLILIGHNTFSTESLTVLVGEYPPFSIYSKDGKLSGLSVDIAKALLEDSGIANTWIKTPWKRALHTAKIKPNTMLLTTTRTPKREQHFHWIGPFDNRNIYIFKLRKRTDIILGSLINAGNYRVAAQAGAAYSSQLKSYGADVYEVVTDLQVMRMMLVDRVDLGIFNDHTIKYLAEAEGTDFSMFERELLIDNTQGYYFAISKDTPPETVKALQDSLDNLMERGIVDQIRGKYLQ